MSPVTFCLLSSQNAKSLSWGTLLGAVLLGKPAVSGGWLLEGPGTTWVGRGPAAHWALGSVSVKFPHCLCLLLGVERLDQQRV